MGCVFACHFIFGCDGNMRIPLATTYKTRTGAPQGKDARLKNCYVEVKGNEPFVRKRPAAGGGATIGSGTAQGGIAITVAGVENLITFNGDIVSTDTILDIADYPTVDFGVVYYAGPAETAYSVPATEITTSIVGITANIKNIVKTVTRTYSSRSVPSQWKVDATWISLNDAEWTPSYSESKTGYGSSQNAAIDNAASLCSAQPAIFYKTAFPGVDARYASYVRPNFRYGIYVNDIFQSYGDSFGYNSVATYTQLTLYYLDVHEVWTYAEV